jgi:hypothetical protein
MSETDAPAWVWQGFFGPMAAAQAGYSAVTIGDAVGVLVPLDDPMPVDREGVMGMFAVQTRPSAPMEPPPGMFEADPSMVGRMVGA